MPASNFTNIYTMWMSHGEILEMFLLTLRKVGPRMRPGKEITRKNPLYISLELLRFPLPAYFPTLPSTRLASLFTRMQAVISLCLLAGIRQGGLEGNTTVGKEEELSNGIIPTMQGTSFRDLSVATVILTSHHILAVTTNQMQAYLLLSADRSVRCTLPLLCC